MSDSPCRVYAARTLEEAKRILSSVEKGDFKSLVLRCFVFMWVVAANCALWVLRLILFKKWGYRTRDFRSIVVYTVGIVGDNVVMLPALAALRRRYPQAKVTVVTNCQIWNQDAARGVLETSPLKDKLIIFGNDPVKRDGFHFVMDETCHDVKCELFVNLSPFGNRGLIGAVVREMIFARKLGAPYAVGFKMSTYSRRHMFDRVQQHFVKNEPRRAREVLRALGLEPAEGEDLFPNDFEARVSVLRKARNAGCNSGSFFVLNPGAKFQAKCWPAERFGLIASYLGKTFNTCSLITGTAEERGIAEEVVKNSGGYAADLTGQTTLIELAELLRMAKGVITNDTGTMHLAAMIGIPTVALFSMRHSPTHWFPLGKKVVALFGMPDCIYCYNDSCHDNICLKEILSNEVIDALNLVLNKGQFIEEAIVNEH